MPFKKYLYFIFFLGLLLLLFRFRVGSDMEKYRRGNGKNQKKVWQNCFWATQMVFLYGDSKTSKTTTSSSINNSSSSSNSNNKETDRWIDLA